MTDSIYDPQNPDVRAGGGRERFLGREAKPSALMPGGLKDGKAEEAAGDAPEDVEQSHEEKTPEAAARALERMQRGEARPDAP
jgi:hypothetical protein